MLKSNGTDGQVVISLSATDAADMDEKEPVFIFFDELPVPYFISSVRRRGTNKILAYLTDTVTQEDAEELAGRDIYMRDGDPDDDAIMDFTGWTLRVCDDGPCDDGLCGDGTCDYVSSCDCGGSGDIASLCDCDSPRSGASRADSDRSRTYAITGIEDIPGNPCLIVETPDGEAMIPLHEDLIIGMDENKKTLTMNLPEGLV